MCLCMSVCLCILCTCIVCSVEYVYFACVHLSMRTRGRGRACVMHGVRASSTGMIHGSFTMRTKEE